MLNKPISAPTIALPKRQKGVVLLITLIVLVSMTLAAIAMVRSVDTGSIIAGNLSFRQAAAASADVGIEAAVNWLAQNKSGAYLYSDHNTVGDAFGYASTHNLTPSTTTSWNAYWDSLVSSNRVVQVTFDANGVPTPGGAYDRDKAGNAVYYTIARLCAQSGDPTGTLAQCSVTNSATNMPAPAQTSNLGAGTIGLIYAKQVYYRITARVEGPHNAIGYVQAVISM